MQQAGTAVGHQERILFVDDVLAICRVAQRMLERCGFRVKVFQDPLAALE